MAASSLEHKTVRPGSLGAYSYYHSSRLPARPPQQSNYKTAQRTTLLPRGRALAAVLAAAVLVGLFSILSGGSAKKVDPQKSSSVTPVQAAATSPSVVTPSKTTNHCAGNTLEHLVLVSVAQRHLWACERGQTVHDAPVITGILAHASTLTPPGTYHISAKATNTTLTGTDETGSWSDPVYYWMPFLDNQHGTYGFHDAPWRADDAFGKTDPNSAEASHGCVELPLASAKWLYNWAPVGTTVTVES